MLRASRIPSASLHLLRHQSATLRLSASIPAGKPGTTLLNVFVSMLPPLTPSL